MRRGEADWHVAANGALCWVFEPYWRDVLMESSRYFDERELRQMAAYWCVSAAADLVGKHLVADTHGIKNLAQGMGILGAWGEKAPALSWKT